MRLSDAIYLVVSESKKGLTMAEICQNVNERKMVTANGAKCSVSLSQVRRAVEMHPLLTQNKKIKPMLIRVNRRAVAAREASTLSKPKGKTKKTIVEAKEDTPIIAECSLCGYRMTVPSRNAPELSDYCPNCGGFSLENDGKVVYYADMFTIIGDEHPQSTDDFQSSKKSKSKPKSTKYQFDDEPQEQSNSKTVTMKTTTLIIILVIVSVIAYFFGSINYETEYEVAKHNADYWKEAYSTERQNTEEWRQRAKEAERTIEQNRINEERKNYHLDPVKPAFDNPKDQMLFELENALNAIEPD